MADQPAQSLVSMPVSPVESIPRHIVLLWNRNPMPHIVISDPWLRTQDSDVARLGDDASRRDILAVMKSIADFDFNTSASVRIDGTDSNPPKLGVPAWVLSDNLGREGHGLGAIRVAIRDLVRWGCLAVDEASMEYPLQNDDPVRETLPGLIECLESEAERHHVIDAEAIGAVHLSMAVITPTALLSDWRNLAQRKSDEDLVSMKQLARICHRSENTLKKYRNQMPEPDVLAAGSRPAQWSYRRVRPVLEQRLNIELPPHPDLRNLKAR